MHLRRSFVALVLLMLLLLAFVPSTALAAGDPPAGWPGLHLGAAALGWLAPLALLLLAVGGTSTDEALPLLAASLAALAVGLMAYAATGFALHLGGVYLQASWPSLQGLAAEWSPNPRSAAGWGLLGLTGFFLSGGAGTADAYALAAVQLPAVSTAVLIPTLALARWLRGRALLGLAAAVGGVLYPLVGNWVWGGGWLARLGVNARWGHGFVDVGGAATVHLLTAATVLAILVVLGRRPSPEDRPLVVELPPVHLPLFVLVGAFLAVPGWLGLVLANPLVRPDLPTGLVALSLILAAMGGAAPALLYTWLATGRTDAQTAARGLVAGLVAASGAAGLMPPFSALGAGMAAGVLVPLVHYGVDHRLRLADDNAALATHGLPGLLSVLWLVLFAEGKYGVGWNGVTWRGEVPQGVSGLFVAPGLGSDIPGQLWAQLAGVAAVIVVGAGLPLLAVMLARAVSAVPRLLGPRRTARRI
ncbi:MAG: hypothetical protein ACUVX9_13875 [Anaerolineae bacterium]